MTRRRLRPDEIELWQKVAQRTERLHPERRTDPPSHAVRPKPKPQKPAFSINEPFTLGQRSTVSNTPHKLQPSLQDRLSSAPVQMDKKSFGKMKRGKLSPEGRIDLHGMTLDRAHPALTQFILSAQASGKRLVLVITGKGKRSDETGPIPRPRGVLRHQVPGWLSSPPLAQAVMQISPAHVSHGGEGAYYVYLRRQR
ncbi:Smr/MutS family protein [bacterium]|nr:Smr/MutS family protein [bacterium]